MSAQRENVQRDVDQSAARAAMAMRAQAREERDLAARDLHEAFLYGGPLEAQRRQNAEQHLEAVRRHEQTAHELERAAQP